jgi:hypothetical protein
MMGNAQQNEQNDSNAMPTMRAAAKSVQMISIAGVCVGSITLLFRFFALLMIFRWILTGRGRWLSQAHQRYGSASAAVFAAFAATLIVISIGCLARKQWARNWIRRYAVCYLVALAVDTGALLFTFLPLINDGQSALPPEDHAAALWIVETTLALTGFGCVLPLSILRYVHDPPA